MTVSSVITVIVHYLDTLEYMCSKNIGIGISISKEGQILLRTGSGTMCHNKRGTLVSCVI